MWEGMEAARASYEIASRSRITKKPKLPYYVFAAAGAAIGIVLIVLTADLLILPAAILITGLVALSTAGLGRKLAATPGLRNTANLGISEEWREAAPVGRVLIVLAVPALIPFAVDMWRGLTGPFRLLPDADSYVYFWRQYGIFKVPDVTIAGIFVSRTCSSPIPGPGVPRFRLCGGASPNASVCALLTARKTPSRVIALPPMHSLGATRRESDCDSPGDSDSEAGGTVQPRDGELS